MKVYIIYWFESFHYEATDKSILKVMTDLDKANAYARRSMSDHWKVQDGVPYQTIIRSDGTICYELSDENSNEGYCVEAYEVDNEA